MPSPFQAGTIGSPSADTAAAVVVAAVVGVVRGRTLEILVQSWQLAGAVLAWLVVGGQGLPVAQVAVRMPSQSEPLKEGQRTRQQA